MREAFPHVPWLFKILFSSSMPYVGENKNITTSFRVKINLIEFSPRDIPYKRNEVTVTVFTEYRGGLQAFHQDVLFSTDPQHN